MKLKLIVIVLVSLGITGISYSVLADYTLIGITSGGGYIGSSSADYSLSDNIAQDVGGQPGAAADSDTNVGYNISYFLIGGEVFQDSDGDNLPDDWEDAYPLPEDESGADDDPDGDGLSNYEEYLAGTDPTSAASFFAVSSIVVSSKGSPITAGSSGANSITLTFPTGAARTYYVYYTDSAFSDDAEWSLAQQVAGTGSVLTWTDDGTYTGTAPLASSIAKRFYRVTPSLDALTDTQAQVTDSAQTTWYVAEGYTGGSFDEWITIMNPGSEDALVEVTYMQDDGTVIVNQITVGAGRRHTISTDSVIVDGSFSTKVESLNGVEIIMERTM